MKLSNKTYDILKPISLWILPLSALVASIGQIWGIPYLDMVSLTLVAIDTFIGAVLTASSKAYYQEATEDGETTD